MSAGQIGGAVVGGAVGFMVGGPAGAFVGAGIGAGLGGALGGGQKGIKPNINTDPGQTSTYGAFITRTHGTIGQSGNIIWLEGNKLRAKVKKAKKSGKGGGAPAAGATVTYFATFAVSLCEGPIAGVRRIWVGPDLFYDAGSDDLETIIASNKALKNFKVYLGTDTQAPNSRIQADRDAENTPAYPGLAYIVVTDLALAKYGNSIQGAQIKVEVVNSASIGVAVAGQYSEPSSQPHENSAFQPKPYFISQEKVVFYAPQWSNDYPAESSWLVYEFHASGLARTYAKGVHTPGVPPSGDSDNDGEAWKDKSDVFSGGGDFSGPDGYIQRRGAVYAGLSVFGGRNLYVSSASPEPQTYAAATSADCFAIVGGQVYTFSSDGIRIYDDKANLAASHLFSLPALAYPKARAENVDGKFLLYDGDSLLYQINADLDGYSLIASVPLIGGGSIYSTSASLALGLLVRGYSSFGAGTLNVQWLNLGLVEQESVPLSGIISEECSRSGIISAGDLDVSGMSDSVIGYRVTASGSIRNALEPLRAAFPFDAYQSGYKIRFRSRGTGSVVTIPIGHLIADTQLEESREMDSQLPQRVAVQYLDRDRDYDQNEQSEERLGAESVDEQSVSIQVVMTAAHAKQTAEKLLYLAWLERYSYNFKLPPIYSGLEPSDVITIAAEYANYEFRLVSANPDSDGVISCSGVPSNAAIYTSAATADAGQQAQVTIPLAGASVAVLLDIPVVDETVQNAPGFVAAMTGYTGGWAGGTIVRSADDGQTWEDVQGFGDKGTFGYTQSPLAANAGNLVQRGGSLTVSLLSGFVDSVTEAQMFGGSNTAAYGAPGRWEIIRFQNATLNMDGSYTLDTFWRGDKGTEWATGLHQPGDLFVLLNDPDNAFVGMSQDSIGQPRTYRAVTFDADIDSASDIAMTYTGVNLECLSPCHPSSSRDGSANLTAKWVRRTRVGGAWRDYVDASLGETSEAYEIDVMSGATVKRTLASSTQSVIYTAANQVTDFGSAQTSITLRIYQLSSVVGRGYPLEATF